MDTVEVNETFVSLQGESTHAGAPCFFVRLAGCNLRCRYCDTVNAWASGCVTPVADLAAGYRRAGLRMAEITGGEPLLQAGFPALVAALLAAGAQPLLVETNGSRDIGVIPLGAVAIMDVKCPGSGEAESMDWRNLQRLRPHDEVKFVIGDRSDYEWARELVRREALETRCHAVLFGPVYEQVAAAQLAEWILADRLPVRLNIQLHKAIGLK